LLLSNLPLNATDTKRIEYKDFVTMVQNNEIKAVSITTSLTENKLVGITSKNSLIAEGAFPDKYDFYTYLPAQDIFISDLKKATGKDNITDFNFSLAFKEAPQPSFLEEFWPYLLPVGLLLFAWFFIMRQSQAGGNKALSFGKSRARVHTDDKNKKTFNDVAGADEEKEELKEIVDFLKSPKRFIDLGARIPKGVLLVGPPGGGKTLLAKAVAGEAGVPFFSISGSDFVEMFVGVGASRVRDLFDTAKKNSPAIVFIDEIDAVGRHRGAGLGGGHDEREQTLNQLLVEMDGFTVNEGIIILAATNRKDILDPALLRPGRFDRQIFVNYPDVKGREEILKVHSRGKPLGSDVDLKVVAKRTPMFTGADLENVLNEAAILTARREHSTVSMLEIEEAITRVIAGPEKKSRVITEKDKRCTAIHEVGHAICAQVLPNCDPVHEISIIPRGNAAGYTLTLPKEDDRHVFMSKMLDDICMMLGGRAAEKLVLNDVSTGAISDLQRATETARSMVVKFGMSEEIGPIFLGGEEEIFVGKEFGHTKNYSEELASKIDHEVKGILERAFDKAREILQQHMHKLTLITEALLEKEKLDADEFIRLFEAQET
jgi:cell division protease FtsH